jgi:hypothetical protein
MINPHFETDIHIFHYLKLAIGSPRFEFKNSQRYSSQCILCNFRCHPLCKRHHSSDHSMVSGILVLSCLDNTIKNRIILFLNLFFAPNCEMRIYNATITNLCALDALIILYAYKLYSLPRH